MENEAKKAINLEDLDKVTGGVDPWLKEMGWDGNCPFCGNPNIQYDLAAKEDECLNCGRHFRDQDIIDLLHKPGEAWV